MKVLDSLSQVIRQKDSHVWSADPDSTVFDALKIMAEKGIGALLVIKDHKLIGVFSERDYARKITLAGRSSKTTKVSEIMTTPVITVTPECTVDEAMRTMTEKHIRHLPIVNPKGDVVNVVSLGDLVGWTIASHEKTIEHLKSYISGHS